MNVKKISVNEIKIPNRLDTAVPCRTVIELKAIKRNCGLLGTCLI